MIYLNESDLLRIGVDWNECITVIEKSILCINDDDFAQPIKPYLRFRNPQNRIIAMPAFVGGDFNIAGIKWIASFPDNIKNNIPRAHSTVILNNADTGEIESIINTSLISIIRTASVSGLLIRYYDSIKKLSNIKLGIIGWGPIGKYHYQMCTSLLGNKIDRVSLYDINGIDTDSIEYEGKNKISIENNWEDVYKDADILITCTVSKEAYIDKKPKEGSLQLNVSLRDYKENIYEYVKNSIIVDNWEEVCRENTDIEVMHKRMGLTKEQTMSIVDVVCNNSMQHFKNEDIIMFNPMGMAIFDISIAKFLFEKAKENQIGLNL